MKELIRIIKEYIEGKITLPTFKEEFENSLTPWLTGSSGGSFENGISISGAIFI